MATWEILTQSMKMFAASLFVAGFVRIIQMSVGSWSVNKCQNLGGTLSFCRMVPHPALPKVKNIGLRIDSETLAHQQIGKRKLSRPPRIHYFTYSQYAAQSLRINN